MTSLRQASALLSRAFDASPSRLENVRNDLIRNGSLPVAKGRAIPTAEPHHVARLVIGLGITDPARIEALASLSPYMLRGIDYDLDYTFADAIGQLIHEAAHPDRVERLSANVTVSGPPLGWIERNGLPLASYGDREAQADFIQRKVTIQLAPLSLFVNLTANARHPFKVAS